MLWVLATTTGYLYYVQFSPTMGNIWYRNGQFVPMNAIDLMIYPFKDVMMWKPALWMINYPIWLFVGFSISKLARYLLGPPIVESNAIA